MAKITLSDIKIKRFDLWKDAVNIDWEIKKLKLYGHLFYWDNKGRYDFGIDSNPHFKDLSEYEEYKIDGKTKAKIGSDFKARILKIINKNIDKFSVTIKKSEIKINVFDYEESYNEYYLNWDLKRGITKNTGVLDYYPKDKNIRIRFFGPVYDWINYSGNIPKDKSKAKVKFKNIIIDYLEEKFEDNPYLQIGYLH